MFINSLIKLINLLNFIFITFAMNINIKNQCPYKIDIFSYENRQFIKKCEIEPNKTEGVCLISINQDVFESGLIKTIDNAEATLFEFTKNQNGIWYDISVIPPDSIDGCLTKGFNIPLQVNVKHTPPAILNTRCNDLICLHNKCPDAYLHPYDDIKTHFCNLNTNFTLTYC